MSSVIIPSTVKGIVMICCVDGHDYNNDASEDDERAELILVPFCEVCPLWSGL